MDAEMTKDELFTEEMVESVAKELGISAENNERVKRIREILNGDVPDELKTADGEIIPDLAVAENYDADLFDLVHKEAENINLIDIAINGIENNTIDIEELVSRSNGIFPDVSREDVLDLIKVAKRYKDGEEFSIYNALPEGIKKVIKMESAASGVNATSLNLFAKMLIEEFCVEVFDVTMEKEAIDFNVALKQALNIPDITQLYEGYIREKMEVELIQKADALQEEFPNGAAVLRRCSEAFTDSYTLTRMRAAITGKTRRKLYKDNEFYNRYCNEFNASIKGSKFRINDVFELGRVLDKLSPIIGIDKEDVLMFVILFCKTCVHLDSNDTADALFMYYSIRNILNMEHHGLVGEEKNEPDEFDQTLINNIASLINDIHVIINERSSK